MEGKVTTGLLHSKCPDAIRTFSDRGRTAGCLPRVLTTSYFRAGHHGKCSKPSKGFRGDEEIIRLRRRLEKAGDHWLAWILLDFCAN